MANLLRLSACLFVLLSFNAKALVVNGSLVVNGCTIEPYTDCSGAGLSFLTLLDANLTNATLSEADLTGTYLTGAYLHYADLSYANLYYADLYGAGLHFANLSGANLHGANLTNANLYGADLYGALYNDQTVLDFDSVAAGMTFVPLPAGIYLFLSGLVGLGLMRGRNG